MVVREEILIGSKADTRGFKKAQTAADKLAKSVKALGVGISAYAAVDFAKTSVRAFIADEQAATKLANAVKNLGMEFANPYIADYISKLEASSKVADDDLRPAFQSLLTTTGSLAKAQEILNTAIEASRGSGYDLATVSNDLAQAYVGNTKGLRKYYLGLDSATLKAKSFTDIQKIMNDQFTGSSAAYLSTYSGQVGVLSLAWQNFQEKVGGTLLTLASFGDGSEGAKLNVLAFTLEKIGSAIELIGKGKETIFGLFDITGKNGLLSKFNPYPQGGGADKKPVDTSLNKYAQVLAKIEEDRKKQNAALIRSNKALTAEQKKQTALKKAASIFDIEQIQIIAALKGNVSKEDRKRLELQLALATENTDLVAKLTKELAVSQGLGEDLAKFLADLPAAKNPFEAWKSFLNDIEAQAMRIAMMGSLSSLYGTPVQNFNPYITTPFPDTTSPSFIGPTVPSTVVVNVAGSVTTSTSLIDEIRGGLNVAALSGSSANVERRIGGW
jgi:hypothetical protein